MLISLLPFFVDLVSFVVEAEAEFHFSCAPKGPTGVFLFQIEHMDWYVREEDDVPAVPDDQLELEALSMEDISPSPENWSQWGAATSTNIGLSFKYCTRSTKFTMEEFNFGGQSLYCSGAPVHEFEGSCNSSACVVPSLIGGSSRTSEASFHGQSEPWLQNSLESADDIFLNLSPDEDSKNIGYQLDSPQMFPDSIHRSVSFEDFLANMLIDPTNLMRDSNIRESSTFINGNSFPLISSEISVECDQKEENSPSCLVPDEDKRLEDSPMAKECDLIELVSAEFTGRGASADVDQSECLEETTLKELEDVMIKFSEKTRICFRDSLYRLAKSSRQQHIVNQNSSANFLDARTIAEVNRKATRMPTSRCSESKTNVIDRTIANIMFNKLHCRPSEVPSPQSFSKTEDDPSASGAYYSWN